ncbi:protein YIPF5 isoform X2 [Copidosoma floridanum]|uniref:protein YIPF5 isoform X2 n=1 Tax=Copidosoma floridanum TaxID=29053 RepID=UPI000C6F44D8|nr:protein YIPF5 isoform X2 [Copidosoma floridanum]
MSDYSNQDNFWAPPPQNVQYNFDNTSFGQPNQQFEFANYTDSQANDYESYPPQDFYNPNQSPYTGTAAFTDEEDEPPLLEELGIDPDRILQKTLAVLNPFHRHGQTDDANYLLQDSDLAGPLAFCLTLAAFLLLAGSKAHFGYVYGLAATSCILMFILHSLMTSSGNVTLVSVASVLGYCILPVVALAGLGIFTSLQNTGGMLLSGFAVLWATTSASRLFCAMSGEEKQRLLIAYPCLLLYGVFTLIVIF